MANNAPGRLATPLTPQQIKAARALLRWPRVRLAARMGASETTLAGYEYGGKVSAALDLLHARAVLEAAGVEFTNGEGLGVRLRTSFDPGNAAIAAGSSSVVADQFAGRPTPVGRLRMGRPSTGPRLS